MKLNPNNPRVIVDEDFMKLVRSIQEDGFMLSIRFLVVDADNVVIGGNQRLRACQMAKLDEVYIVKAEDLTKDQLKEFIVKDNTYFGHWDKEMLSQNYSDREMVEVGMDLVEVAQPRLEVIGDIETEIDASDLQDRKETHENNKIMQIVTYFPAELYEKVIESFSSIKNHMNCQENPEALLKLISYWKFNYGS